ncbi:MAG TPA: AmmeMemoRadiSam system radical SAM enzyme [Candidatus Binatus sp.]|nr:AmmeMemoRadiSam system radical SAM enzyme [Candidatus Binatus sp.]
MALAVRTVLTEPQADGAVRCHVCAHRCLIRPGRDGICHVRANRDGVLQNLAYGRIAAAALDPIEKKPLFHVEPGSRAWSIATPGCPFHCTFCQNWQIAQAPRLGTPWPRRVTDPGEVVEEALEGDADAIAYTYVEPTVFLEYVLDVGGLAREAGLRNLFITDGYATPEAIRLLATVVDAANVDLKSFDDRFYRRLCGARLAPVLDGITAMREAGIFLELTTLVIPGLNDDEANLRALTQWIVSQVGPETPWHVSRFYPAYELRDIPPTPLESLRRAASIGCEAGLAHVYVGNAPELEAQDTHCAGCGRVVIERHGYRVRNDLRPDGTCRGCGRRLAGIGLSRGTSDAAPTPGTGR